VRIVRYVLASVIGLCISAFAVFLAVLHGSGFFYFTMGVFALAHVFCLYRAIGKDRSGNHDSATRWLLAPPLLGFFATTAVIVVATLFGYG
jgi:hypothetical protein